MKYPTLPGSFFAGNREKFMASMKPGSIALFFANPQLPVNADAQYRYLQNSNFYYLTGIEQENAALLLFPDAPKETFKEILFVQESNEYLKQWEGWKYTKDEAQEAAGMKRLSQIDYYQNLENVILTLISHADNVYLDFNEHDRNRLFIQTAAHKWAEYLQKWFPGHQLLRSNHLVSAQRQIKQPIEIEQLKKAVDITHKAFLRVMSMLRAGIKEYEVEAELFYEYYKNGATGVAFDSIIATGKNACILHYVLNDTTLQDGDLILMDFGVKYGYFNSDITRCAPVSGKFTTRQKDIYSAVLRLQKAGIQNIRKGNTLDENHKKVGELANQELFNLGLLTKDDLAKSTDEKPAYKKYFSHGLGHHLGIDVHDVGSRYAPLQPGMVLTVEPGFYVSEEGIGIRLENDIVVTDGEPLDLMANIPIEIDEIEALMAR